MEEFVHEGDTVSYDLVLRREGAEVVHRLRFEVVYVGNDFHWYTPIVLGGVMAVIVAYPELSLRVLLNAL
jgi:hypothetical protein